MQGGGGTGVPHEGPAGGPLQHKQSEADAWCALLCYVLYRWSHLVTVFVCFS